MYSLNVKSHLEHLVASYLSEFVEEYDSSSLSIGLWQGNVRLKNLRLKPRVLDISDDFHIKLEYGLIGDVQISVPWTQLQSGNVNIIIDKVHLVGRVELEKSTYSPSDSGNGDLSRKLEQLSIQERKALGYDTEKNSGFASRFINSFASSLLSNILNGVSINISDIKVSLLSALLEESEVAHVRLCFESITIDKNKSVRSNMKKGASYNFAKNIEFHGISLEVNRKSEMKNDKLSFYDTLCVQPLEQLVLNPVHVEIFLVMFQRSHEQDYAGSSDHLPQMLSLDMKVSNIEITPNMNHLIILQEAMDQPNLSKMRKFGLLPPPQPPSLEVGNCKEWWRYAVFSTLRQLYGELYVPMSLSSSIVTPRRFHRNRYIYLHCKLLESRILHSQSDPATDISDALNEDEVAEWNDLHIKFSMDELLLYRSIVRKNLQKLGYSFDEVCAAVISNPLPSRWTLPLAQASEASATLKQSIVEDNIDSAILEIFSDIKAEEDNKKRINQLAIDVNVVVPRFAMSLLQDNSSKDAVMSTTAAPALLLVLYGFQVSYAHGELSGDKTIGAHLGAVRMYGLDGVEIFSCGNDADMWLHNYDVSSLSARNLALSVHLQWCVLNSGSLDGLKPNPRLSGNSDKTHIVADMSIANITFSFDASTALFIDTTLTELRSLRDIDFNAAFDPSGSHPLQSIRRLCAVQSLTAATSTEDQASLSKTISVNLVINGVRMDIPIVHTEETESGFSPRHKLDSKVSFSLGSLRLRSGDFIDQLPKNLLDFDETIPEDDLSDIPTRYIWPEVDRILKNKLHRSSGPLLNNVLFELSNAEIMTINQFNVLSKITKNPLGMKGIVSRCSLPCHKVHPDYQVETYCSPFRIHCCSEDLMGLIKAIGHVMSSISPDESKDTVQDATYRLRIKRLSGNCFLRASVHVDEIGFALLSSQRLEIEHKLNGMLRTFLERVRKRGSYSRAVHTNERLTIQRMRTIGIDVEAASSALRGIRSSIDIDNEFDADTIIADTIESLRRSVGEDNFISNFSTEPLFAITFSGIHVNNYSLTYDSKTSFYVEEVLAVDQDCNPILHAFCEVQGRLDCLSRQSKAKDKMKKKFEKKRHTKANIESLAKQLESIGMGSYSAIALVYTMQDERYSWGGGGHSSNALYEKLDVQHVRKWDINCSLQFKNLDIILSPNGMPRIVSNILPLVEDLYKACAEEFGRVPSDNPSVRPRSYQEVIFKKKKQKYSQHQRAMKSVHGDFNAREDGSFDILFASPEAKHSFEISLGCAHVVCSVFDELLTECSIHKLSANYSVLCHHDSQSSKSAALSIQNFELHDLSTLGTNYPSVIWKERKSARNVATISVAFEGDLIDVAIDLQGVRVVVMSRFIVDLISFFEDHFFFLITSSLVSLHSTIDLVVEQQKADYQMSDEILTLNSMSTSSDESGDDSSEEDIAGNAFFEYPVPDLDLDDLRGDSNHIINTTSSNFLPGMSSSDLKNNANSSSFRENFDFENIKSQSNNTSRKVSWRLLATNLNVILPRNSGSDDLVALKIGSLELYEKKVGQSWDAPSSDNVVPDDDHVYFFDFESGKWLWSQDGTEDRDYASACSINSVNDFDMTPGSFSTSLFNQPYDRSSTLHTDRNGRVWSFDEDEEFQDTFQSESSFDDTDAFGGRNYEHTPFFQNKRKQESLLEDTIDRYCLTVCEVDVYCSVDGTLSIQKPPVPCFYEEHKHFVEIRNARPVYSILHCQKNSPRWSSQVWNKITPSSINMTVVIDLVPDRLRILVSETNVASKFHFKTSMSEFYLIQSVYFDNMQEGGAFFIDDLLHDLESNKTVVVGESSYEKGHNEKIHGENASKNTFKTSIPEYGTLEFWVHIRRSLPSLEFMLVRSSICLECSMDTNYFPHEIQSLQYLGTKMYPFAQFDFTENRRVPFASIAMRWASLCVLSSDDVLQVALGSAGLQIQDLRGPQFNFAPLVFDSCGTAQSKVKHGFADFDFGLKEGPYSLGNSMEIPVQLTCFLGGNWQTVNLGLDSPNINLKNLDVVWLLSDFFSNYYCYSEFGNPSVIAYNICVPPPDKMPYKGLDTRVFLKKPHCQTRQSNANPNSQMLFMEADTGVFIRYMYDSLNSVRIEVLAQDISAVLMQSYMNPTKCRGMRGTTGSGHGRRTILEFFTISYSYQYDHKLHEVDNLLAIVPSSRNSHPQPKEEEDEIDASFRPYINFDDESLVLPSCSVNSPKCVAALAEPSRDFPVHCCTVVSSYEDILFAIDLVTEFIYSDSESEGKDDAVDSSDESDSEASPMMRSRKRASGIVGHNGVSDQKRSKKVKIPPAEPLPPISTFAILRIQAVKLTLVDHVLGLHLPLAQFFLSKLSLTMDEVPPGHIKSPTRVPQRTHSTRLVDSEMGRMIRRSISMRLSPLEDGNDMFANAVEEQTYNARKKENPVLQLPETKVYGETLLWGDYYNNLLKCWEPFVEPVSLVVVHEKNRERGVGIVVRATSAVHINLSLAMIRTVNDCLRVGQEDLMVSSSDSVLKYRKKELSRTTSLSQNESVTIDGIEHVFTSRLKSDVRVGFSILNKTGNPLRYLQTWGADGGQKRQTVEYLEDGEKGLLNFIASNTVIRNNHIVEESFSDQSQSFRSSSRERGREKRGIGHRVTLQIAGYKWTTSVQADTLGLKFIDLENVMGTLNTVNFYKSWRIKNALKLVCEVRPHNGGRLLQLNSSFVIKNCTNHAVKLRTHHEVTDVNPNELNSVPFLLPAGESFYVPFALLTQSVAQTGGKSLGHIWLAPESIAPVEDELDKPSRLIGEVNYSIYPISLMNTVQRVSELMSDPATKDSFDGVVTDLNMSQLSCSLTGPDRRGLSRAQTTFTAKDTYERDDVLEPSRLADDLPSFCYNLEIETTGHDDNLHLSTESDVKKKSLFHHKERHVSDVMQPPLIYSLAIHPPIIVENLLPVAATFELVHARNKRVLWSSMISPGKVKTIHTVNLDNPILILINLDFCRSSEGVLVHRPLSKVEEERGIASTIQRTIEGFLEDSESSPTDTSIILTDAVGQRLRLEIENKMGGGGHRSIVVYCPYWIVNTSQYSIRLREDGALYLPAGTVTPQRDGTTPVTTGHSLNDGLQNRKSETRGKPGPLHTSKAKQVAVDDPLRGLLRELSFDQIVDMASMFSFLDSGTSKLLGTRKVIAQVDNSNWSSSFTLESAGVIQTLSVNHADLGVLELSFKINTAPGRLANYTKVVRFSPRFVVINNLKLPARIIQVNGFRSEQQVPIDISPNHLRPFHLPTVYGERQLAVQLNGPWVRSVPFDIDKLGSYSMIIHRVTDTSKLDHILTRGAPEYNVRFESGEIGIWFETDWDLKIVVRRLKPGSYAATRTDIMVGDVLLSVGSESTADMSFDDAMKRIKSLQSEGGYDLTFQTVEQKLRLIRETAKSSGHESGRDDFRQNERTAISNSGNGGIADVPYSNKGSIPIVVEMRIVDSSVFLMLSELDMSARPEYRVVNNSHCNVIYYRQKGILEGRWASLGPGMSAPYIWDNPIKSRKLIVRVGENILCPTDSSTSNQEEKSFFVGGSSDKHAAVINFDDIGSEEIISVPGVAGKLKGQVFSEGPTKVLKVFPSRPSQDNKELHFTIDFMAQQIVVLKELYDKVRSLSLNRVSSEEDQVVIRDYMNAAQDSIIAKQQHLFDVQDAWDNSENDEEKLTFTTRVPFQSLLGPIIARQGQLLVEVISVAGTKPVSLGGKNEIYCELGLKSENAVLLKHFKQKQKTYVNDESVNPKWVKQIFIFDIPVNPEQSIRGYSVRVKVKHKAFIGSDGFLGQADIQFASLEDENKKRGWFPLQPKKNSIKASPQSLEVTGSIKLRVQWIHSSGALLEHVKEAVDKRLDLLGEYQEVQERVLRTMVHSSANLTQTARPSSLKAPGRKKKHVGVSSTSLQLMQQRSSGCMSAPANILFVGDERSQISARDARLFYNSSFSSVQSMCAYYKEMFDNSEAGLAQMMEAPTMRRGAKFTEQCSNFLDDIEDENLRAFTQVVTRTGTIEITPIQALHLPDPSKPVYVKFTYGDIAQRTVSAPPTAYPVWDSEALNESYAERDSRTKQGILRAESLTRSFEIDTLNSFGDIGIHVMQERLPFHVELARLEIPIFEMLYCICTHEGKYDRWFPLSISKLCVPTDGDMGISGRASCSEQRDSAPYGYNACIRLSLRWNLKSPEKTVGAQLTSQKYARISLPALSLSVIDSNKSREVMQLVINDIEGRHADSLEETNTSLNVAWIQIDNQLPQPLSPVILAPTSVPRPQPALRMHARKNNTLSHEHLESYDSIEVIVQELDLHLEQQTVLAVWDLIKGIKKEKKATDAMKHKQAKATKVSVFKNYGFELERESEKAVKPVPESDKANKEDESSASVISAINKVYIDSFAIAPMKINVSFIMTPHISSSEVQAIDTSDVDEDVGDSDKAPVSSFLYQVGEVVLDLTSTITDSPIKLNGLTNTHMFETWDTILVTLQGHYLSSALSQMYKIVGSLDLVGNPVGLLSSLGVGVKDFFFEPATAFIKNPKEIKRVGHVFMKGGVSLISNTADGVIGTATTMTRSVGKGIAALTMDDIFLRNREKLNKNPELIADIMSRPFKDIGNGVYCGIVGIIRVPYNNTIKYGPVGFVTGLAGAIAGVAAKPVVGVLDAVTHTGEGCRHLIKSANRKIGAPAKRRRYANVFGPDGRLMPFSYSTAYGTHVLRLLDQIFWDKSGSGVSDVSFKGDSKRKARKSVRVGQKSIQQAQTAQNRDFGHRLGKRGSMMSNQSFGRRSLANLGRKSVPLAPRAAGRKGNFESQLGKGPGGSNMEMKQMESVIYTAIVPLGPGDDELVIVTTKRVVVGEYKREKGWAWVDVMWQCDLNALDPPAIERSGGGTVSLRIKGQTFSSQVDSSETITADYGVLVDLSNCLNTILQEFDLITPSGDNWAMDNQGIIRIGAWQYHQPDQTSGREDKNLVEKLEECRWAKPPRSSYNESAPEWMVLAREEAVRSHDDVKLLRKLVDDCSAQQENTTISMCVDKLRQGLMTGAEFRIFVEAENNLGKLMKPDSSAKELELQSKEKKSITGLRSNLMNIAHKLKGAVVKKKHDSSQAASLSNEPAGGPEALPGSLPDPRVGLKSSALPSTETAPALTNRDRSPRVRRVDKVDFSSSDDVDSSDDSAEYSSNLETPQTYYRGADRGLSLGKEYNPSFQSSDDDDDEASGELLPEVLMMHKNIASMRHSSVQRAANGRSDAQPERDSIKESSIGEVMERLQNMESLLATVLSSDDDST